MYVIKEIISECTPAIVTLGECRYVLCIQYGIFTIYRPDIIIFVKLCSLMRLNNNYFVFFQNYNYYCRAIIISRLIAFVCLCSG